MECGDKRSAAPLWIEAETAVSLRFPCAGEWSGGAFEVEVDRGGAGLAIHFYNGIGQEVDRTGDRAGIDHEVASATELKTVGGRMTKIIHAERREFVAFTDIDGPPFAIRIEFGPAVIAIHAALIALGGEGRADSEAGGNASGSRQGDEK